MTDELSLDQMAARFSPMATLYRKKAQVMGLLDPVKKSGTDATKGFSYMTASALKHAVREAMAQVGLSLSVSLQTMDVETTDKGRRTIARFAFSICDGETGASETSEWIGIGSDAYSDDKGFNKASTSAMKYFLAATFLVSAEDSGQDQPSSKQRDARTQTPSPKAHAPETARTASAQAAPQTPAAAPSADVTLSSTDKDKWPKFLAWAKDKFKYDERVVCEALSGYLGKDGHYSGSRDLAMGCLLAMFSGYDAEIIEDTGARLKLPDAVIQEAALIRNPAAMEKA
jgi:hypothetical protein